LITRYEKEAVEKGIQKDKVREYVGKLIRPSVECADVPDDAYNDGANARKAKDLLADLGKQSEPFFLAVGFVKPHLPFVAPKRYWDIYERERMPVAQFQKPALHSPALAYHHASELLFYSDIPSLATFTDQQAGITVPIEKQKELIHGYYACVSYTDAQVGVLLDALDSLGLSQNTIVILWGDHGWHLGDHELWCKHTNFEQATHVPLIISAPWIQSSVSDTPSEFVDIFPTLCDLAGLSIPTHLDGLSLVPAMNDPHIRIKEYAVSQYPRTTNSVEVTRLGYSAGEYMGYSIRNTRYRYTIWIKDYFRSTEPYNENLRVAEELYDYEKDPLETVNVVEDNGYSSVRKTMHQQILEFLASQAHGN
jgi:arylsulfatase A-like enzyme